MDFWIPFVQAVTYMQETPRVLLVEIKFQEYRGNASQAASY